jgi:hypothetical protein
LGDPCFIVIGLEPQPGDRQLLAQSCRRGAISFRFLGPKRTYKRHARRQGGPIIRFPREAKKPIPDSEDNCPLGQFPDTVLEFPVPQIIFPDNPRRELPEKSLQETIAKLISRGSKMVNAVATCDRTMRSRA